MDSKYFVACFRLWLYALREGGNIIQEARYHDEITVYTDPGDSNRSIGPGGYDRIRSRERDEAANTCPVMGNPIDKSVYVDYKGKGSISAVKAAFRPLPGTLKNT